MIGKTLGHYQITSQLGKGGMGEVFQAKDQKLGRDVAIKLLPEEFAKDADRVARFQREAKVLASLNHPNIAAIHGLEESGGTNFLVLELVEGQTLADRIKTGPVPVEESLKLALQIAEALEAAHEKGVIHRDLKPANIKVTPDGKVKVLDFGLAKLTEHVQGDDTASTATVDSEGRPITEEGVIVGTVAYMSPEQAEGKKVDARSDIFSLGSVLYEMVTGQKAFQGTSKMSTLSAILHQEPKPVSTVTQTIPAEFERLINRCLRKDPKRRWQTMADLKVALDELKEDSDSGRLQAAPAVAKQVASKRLMIGAVVVAAMIVLALAGWYWLSRQRPAEPEAPLVAVPLTSYAGREVTPSFSPDGRQVAFQWCTEGPSANCDIYIKQIPLEPPFRLTSDPAEDFSPTWSPDGQFIAFLRMLSPDRAALMLIPQRGGQERLLEELDLPGGWLGSGVPTPYVGWATDSKWLVVPSSHPGKEAMGLWLVSTETLEKRRLTTPPAGSFDTTPAFSPDGRTLAFTRFGGGRSGICFLRLGKNYEPQGEPPRPVTPEEQSSVGVAWTPDGRDIVSRYGFFRDRGLWRMSASMSGKPVRLAFASDATSAPAISRQGNRLVYEAERWNGSIYRVDLSGPSLNPGIPFKFISSTRDDWYPAYSPDGKKIAFSSDRSGSWEIWVCDRDGANTVRLTSLGGEDIDRATWSPDGRNIAFGLVVGGKRHIFVANANGGAPRRLTTDPESGNFWPYWSRDGRWIYFRTARSSRSSEIWKMPPTGGDAVQITRDPGADLPRESHDGKFVYYSKGWPNPQSVWKVSVEGGAATKILDGVHRGGLWTVGPDGIYFFTEPDDKGQSDLSVHEFATGKTRKILTARAGMIEVSPDLRTILYRNPDEAGSDLMLVENFR